MAGTISFGGIGSGLDVEGIVTGLKAASSTQLNSLSKRTSLTRSAASSISEISGLLSQFKTAVSALDEATETRTYTASSSSTAAAVSVSGAAQPGQYTYEVSSLAKEARVYSNTLGTGEDPIGQTGSITLNIAGEEQSFTIGTDTSLNDLVAEINDSGLRVSATTFFDGSERRLILTGLDKGEDNALTITETGLDLGLNLESNIKQSASDAEVLIDGFPVSSQSNQILGAIPGVTLALTAETTEPQTITVEADPEGLKTKLQAVVDAYNKVNSKIHFTSGFGDIKASNQELAGDSTLRTVTSRLSSSLMTIVDTGGDYTTLASLGLSIGRDGSLSLDSTKLEAALAQDPASVAEVLGGTDSTDGAMDVLRDLADSFTQSGDGLLTNKKQTLEDRANDLQDRVDREQARLDRYADQLRRQFASVEGNIAGSYADLDYLMSLFSG